MNDGQPSVKQLLLVINHHSPIYSALAKTNKDHGLITDTRQDTQLAPFRLAVRLMLPGRCSPPATDAVGEHLNQVAGGDGWSMSRLVNQGTRVMVKA